ncbi:nickel pincer cofactor biosynthesis protein LarB [Embleya sp. AB8]|uniref:nickel pincer cofactor biosynthesis protein LarB n=1 Tax=Embleya sp. AB8 TaxID=3156304 RepID=UPI003C72CC25
MLPGLSGTDSEAADRVGTLLHTPGRLGVAFSGGVDSCVPLALAVRALGADRAVAVLGVSPSLAVDERTAALGAAAKIGARVVEVATHEGDPPTYRANGLDRCFHRKDELFARIFAEVVRAHDLTAVAYGEGKTPDQVGAIAVELRERGRAVALFTRAGPEHARAVLAELPDARHESAARLLVWPPEPPAPEGGLVVVLAAGTSELPVAREAEPIARYPGRRCELAVGVGVAGLHRVIGMLDLLRSARVVVVAAGMDGALPSVVAGLVAAPVVAVPTSIGYGAAFGGLAPLLSMLNACSPGVAVVNIDNGFGAGHLAAQIAAPPTPAAGAPSWGSDGRE